MLEAFPKCPQTRNVGSKPKLNNSLETISILFLCFLVIFVFFNEFYKDSKIMEKRLVDQEAQVSLENMIEMATQTTPKGYNDVINQTEFNYELYNIPQEPIVVEQLVQEDLNINLIDHFNKEAFNEVNSKYNIVDNLLNDIEQTIEKKLSPENSVVNIQSKLEISKSSPRQGRPPLNISEPRKSLKKAAKEAMTSRKTSNSPLRPLSEERKDKNLNNNPRTSIERHNLGDK